MRTLDAVKNNSDLLFREYAPDTNMAKQAKSALDALYMEVAMKLKVEGNYDGSAANLVYGDVSCLSSLRCRSIVHKCLCVQS